MSSHWTLHRRTPAKPRWTINNPVTITFSISRKADRNQAMFRDSLPWFMSVFFVFEFRQKPYQNWARWIPSWSNEIRRFSHATLPTKSHHQVCRWIPRQPAGRKKKHLIRPGIFPERQKKISSVLSALWILHVKNQYTNDDGAISLDATGHPQFGRVASRKVFYSGNLSHVFAIESIIGFHSLELTPRATQRACRSHQGFPVSPRLRPHPLPSHRWKF